MFAWNWAAMNNSAIKNVVNQGGTNSGKTYSICQVLLLWAFQNANKTITITGMDLPQIKGDVLNEFKKVLDSSILTKARHGKMALQTDYEYNKSSPVTFTLHNGTTIEFRSYADEDDAKGKRDVLYVFESYNIDWALFDALALRTSYKVFICYNPTARYWAHERLHGQPTTQLIISNFTHNDYLAPNIRASILAYNDPSSQSYDPYKWRVLGLGCTGAVTGVLFPKCYQISDSDYPITAKKTAYGLDFGYSNDPSVLCELSLNGGKLYAKELFYETGLRNIDIHNKLVLLGIKKDAVIIADSSEPKTIDDLRAYGWNVKPAKKGADSVEFGIKKINEYDLHITASSTNAWYERDKYVRNPKTDKPIDKYNHFFDALRYAAESVLCNQKEFISNFKVR